MIWRSVTLGTLRAILLSALYMAAALLDAYARSTVSAGAHPRVRRRLQQGTPMHLCPARAVGRRAGLRVPPHHYFPRHDGHAPSGVHACHGESQGCGGHRTRAPAHGWARIHAHLSHGRVLLSALPAVFADIMRGYVGIQSQYGPMGWPAWVGRVGPGRPAFLCQAALSNKLVHHRLGERRQTVRPLPHGFVLRVLLGGRLLHAQHLEAAGIKARGPQRHQEHDVDRERGACLSSASPPLPCACHLPAAPTLTLLTWSMRPRTLPSWMSVTNSFSTSSSVTLRWAHTNGTLTALYGRSSSRSTCTGAGARSRGPWARTPCFVPRAGPAPVSAASAGGPRCGWR